MKKVLIIIYEFPPKKNVGALRMKGIAKYLPEFGWYPIIITSLLPENPPEGFYVIETHPPYREVLGIIKEKNNFLKNRLKEISKNSYHIPVIKRFFSLIRESFPFPDTKVGWYIFAFYICKYIIKEQNIKAIITNSYPFTSHLIGYNLKKIFPEIFWIADSRDIWTLDPYYPQSGWKYFLSKNLEKKVFSKADVLTTVSPLLSKKLMEKYNKKCFSIPHGFDPDEFFHFVNHLDSKFTITYTGSLYKGKRNPQILFDAIKSLINKGRIKSDDIVVNFYGDECIKEVIKKLKIEKFVKYKGRISREETLKKQKSSQILLLINGDSEIETFFYTSKMFEYLAAQRPILAIGKGGIIQELLNETKSGVFCEDINSIEKQLLKWYEEWKLYGEVKFRGDRNKILKYSHIEMAKKFANILNGFYKNENK